MALGDRRRGFGVVSDPEPPAAVTPGDVERFLKLIDLLSNVEKTRALTVEAGRAQSVIDSARAESAALTERKERIESELAEKEAAHRARIDDEHGKLTEEVRAARAEIESDRRSAAELKKRAEAELAAASQDKAEAARRLRAMAGEAA